MTWVDWMILVFSILLISLVALQQSKDDISDAFSGEKSELFKNQKMRGFEFFLSMATLGTSLCFITFIMLSYYGVGR